MQKRTSKNHQQHLLYTDLIKQLNPNVPLLLLAKHFPWEILEEKFAPLYAVKGRKAKPVRLMVGLLLLKQMENLSDKRLLKLWVQNPYFQAFCGMQYFQWQFPCDSSDITYFRKRIGEEGVQEIFNISVSIHGKSAQEKDIVIDTTVQEKNITFPTDTKLYIKIICKCRVIASKEKTALRRSFTRELPKLLRTIRFSHGKKSNPQRKRARKRVKTIAGILLRGLRRKFSKAAYPQYTSSFELFEKVLQQKKGTKNKTYSLHEPQTVCIAKGKQHKKYEFGAKAGLALTKTTGIIVGAKSFIGNPYDGNTLDAILEQVKTTTNQEPSNAFCDRGFRGRNKVGNTTIYIPGTPPAASTAYAKRKAKKNFGRRSAIEPVIGHLKSDFRMARNYLKGSLGDAINLLMAATAFNLTKWMRLVALCLFFALCGFFSPKRIVIQ